METSLEILRFICDCKTCNTGKNCTKSENLLEQTPTLKDDQGSLLLQVEMCFDTIVASVPELAVCLEKDPYCLSRQVALCFDTIWKRRSSPI